MTIMHPWKKSVKTRTINFIRKSVKADKPFFITYQPLVGSFLGTKPGTKKKSVAAGILQEFFVEFDAWIPTLMKELKDQGIEENTLVILMADNGPMTHIWTNRYGGNTSPWW